MKEYQYMKNGRCIAFLGERPFYCDRGRYHAIIDIGLWVSDADHWPRYYFDLRRGMEEVLEFLKGKQKAGKTRDPELNDFSGGYWEEVEHSGEVETRKPFDGPKW